MMKETIFLSVSSEKLGFLRWRKSMDIVRGKLSNLIIPVMFIYIFIQCPLTWDRKKEIRKKYRTPRIVDTALNIWESNDIFLF